MVVSRDLVAGTLMLAASVGYYVTATGIPVSLIDTTVNSSALPKLLGIGGAGLSVVLIVQALLRQRRASAAAPAPEPPASASELWLQHRRALGVLIIVASYALLLNTLGYFVSMALLLGATAYYQAHFYRNVRSMPVMIGLALGGALLFWTVFDRLVGIPMPVGLWRHLW